MCRTRKLNELATTAEGRDRLDRDGEMRQDKRARDEMDAGDGHDTSAEAWFEDEQLKEARSDGPQQPQKR